jgi:hypothetical protein
MERAVVAFAGEPNGGLIVTPSAQEIVCVVVFAAGKLALDVVVVTLNERNAAPETCSDEMLIRWIAEGDQLACCLTGAELLCIAGCCSSSAKRL